ncbi:MAG: signal peptidase I [Gammaproteobacteria bacterium]|nr:signal peptidase I [Gammaproteobacteria bacterium]
MNFNFELILFYAVLISGIIYLLDVLFFAKKRRSPKMPVIIEYARSFFPILLIVFFLRSFLFEPFRIPSSSLEPTLLVGDFVLVNKFAYGLRLPVLHNKIMEIGEPKRGDIFVFRYPPKPSIDFIKRVIGLPGDHLKYIDKVLYVNGEKIPQELKENLVRVDEQGNKHDAVLKEENLLGVKHVIYQNKDQEKDDFDDVVVPPGMYFAMGDNRDDSADSRFWGFVPEANIIGKAMGVWMSWNSDTDRIRWNRIGTKIH